MVLIVDVNTFNLIIRQEGNLFSELLPTLLEPAICAVPAYCNYQ